MKIETATIRRLRDALLQSGRRPSAVLSPAFETLAREGILSDDERAAVDRVDPLAETMFLMMSADGKITDAERDAIRGAIRGLSDNILHAGTIDVMLEGYQRRVDKHGRDARLEEVARAIAQEPAEAEGAFALAAAVALADDDVDQSESTFIVQLAEWFGISEDRATSILDQLEEEQDD